jgi:hypothetical protein
MTKTPDKPDGIVDDGTPEARCWDCTFHVADRDIRRAGWVTRQENSHKRKNPGHRVWRGDRQSVSWLIPVGQGEEVGSNE